MKCKSFVVGMLIAMTFTTGSCQTFQNGGAPALSYDLNKDLQALSAQYSQASSIQEYFQNPSTAARDKFVAGRLVLIDIHYLQFVRGITQEKQLLDSASEMLALSLGLAGASVGSSTTKSILAAISAGVTGSKAIIDKDYFYEKTVPALVSSMNAARKTALIPILQGMKLDINAYPIEQAIVDLDNYYQAGTFDGALESIQISSGLTSAAKQQEIDDIRGVGTGLTLNVPGTALSVSQVRQALTDALGKLTAADLVPVDAALTELQDHPTGVIVTDKDLLQSHVRNARDPNAAKAVLDAFDHAHIPH